MKRIYKIIFISVTGYHSLMGADINIDKILKKMKDFKKIEKISTKIVLKYDPFFPNNKKEDKKIKKNHIKQTAVENYKLKAILNQKAFINKKWYKIGDIIDSYKIDKIGSEKVLLVRGKKSKVLSLTSPKKLLKIEDNKI